MIINYPDRYQLHLDCSERVGESLLSLADIGESPQDSGQITGEIFMDFHQYAPGLSGVIGKSLIGRIGGEQEFEMNTH
jgi:hypothetical protein